MKLQANFKMRFEKNAFNNAMMENIESALYKVGAAIVEDTIIQQPRPPILTGDLRSSYSIELNGKLLDKGNNADESLIAFARKQNLLRVSFNTVYAAKWHERPFQPGPVSSQDGKVGNKYLSSKIERYSNKYFQIFAKSIRI